MATPETSGGFTSLVGKYGGKMTELGGPAQGNFFVLMGNLINVLLSVLSVILLGFIIVAGFYWITAGGNDSQVKKAKALIQNAVIGLIIIMMSFALARFIETSLIVGLGAPADTTFEDCTEAIDVDCSPD
jgi:amino acid transporter